MRRYLDAESLATEIRMLRRRYRGAFIVVEGDTDAQVFGAFVDATQCAVVPGLGKDHVLGALRILENEGWRRVLGVVDADFSVLERLPAPSPNVLRTDTHDVETMMLSSPALQQLLVEYGFTSTAAPSARKRFEKLREVLLRAGTSVGYLRWASERYSLGLKFDGLDFTSFVHCGRRIYIDVRQMRARVIRQSDVVGLAEADLRAKMDSLRSDDHDLWHVCCGHDLVEILLLVLRSTLHKEALERNQLESDLRRAYTAEHFRSTALYESMVAWQRSSGYVLFAMLPA